MGMIIFSDLDGTLLDHHTYAWQAAAPALGKLAELKVPLILCSSKTRVEMLPLQRDMGISGPMICENGGGVFAPLGHFITASGEWRDMENGWVMLAIGMPIAELRRRFAGFKERFKARGFSDMSDEEVAGLTGLSPGLAALARRREFNEPVLLPDMSASYSAFAQAAQDAGLQVTRGGRFVHLLGGGDKGKAVTLVSGLYQDHDQELSTMALGDAPNDAAMLRRVDKPVLVARPDGSHADLDITALVKTAGVGPAGWNQAVLAALAELE
jgi:mannosyl-3-phosphoglycerate phosphatase family protein